MSKDSLRFLGDSAAPVDCTCNILDKLTSTFQYVQYMLDRTNRMFKYTGLPETIPEYMFEIMLQVYGSVAVLEHKNSLYAFRCSFGGPPDPYYRPTQAVVANPALNIEYTYRIANYFPPFDTVTWKSYPPCVKVLNDSQEAGLIPLFSRYATQMTENDISIRSAQINLRSQTIIAANNGPEMESANAYIKGIEEGRLLAIAKTPFLDGINVMATKDSSDTIIQLIELQQYLKASWYNEIGLNSNFNMKRQYMSTEEVNSSADIMLPLIDNMLNCRQEALEAINKEFGTNIIVEKDSAWAKKQIQADISTSVDLDTGYSLPVDGTTDDNSDSLPSESKDKEETKDDEPQES